MGTPQFLALFLVRIGVVHTFVVALCPVNLLDDVVDEERLYIVWVAEFSDVEFYGDQIAFCHAVECACFIVEKLSVLH